MSDDPDRTKDRQERAPEQRAAAGQQATPEPAFDEEGLPLHRPPTLDDVRGGAGSGRTIAIGCAILVALAVLAFWIVRAGLLD